MRVELVRAWQGRSEATTVELPAGATVGDALDAAGWTPGGGFDGLAVFGQAATRDSALHEGDRVELLRPLQVDPKQARRLRAERARETRAKGKPAD